MRFILKNATALLPDGSCARRHVLIEGDRILRVSAEPLDMPAQTIDLAGAFLMAGLIHTHLHLMDCFDGFSDEKLNKWLEAGFTTVRDEGVLSLATPQEAVAWRERVRHDVRKPHLLVCGPFVSTPGGYGGASPIGVNTVEEARDAVRRLADAGVDHIKTALDNSNDAYHRSLPCLSEEQLSALCDEAHRLGKRVSAHTHSAEKLAVLVRAGVDEIAHACCDRIPNELLQSMVRQNIAMTPTLSVYGEATTNWGAPLLANASENVRRFSELGGVIGFGNDYIAEKPIWSPLGMPMMEVFLLQKAGLSMRAILQSMTLGGATIIGRDDLGRVQEGCHADLSAVRGDPIELPYLLSHMSFIMKDGIVIRQE